MMTTVVMLDALAGKENSLNIPACKSDNSPTTTTCIKVKCKAFATLLALDKITICSAKQTAHNNAKKSPLWISNPFKVSKAKPMLAKTAPNNCFFSGGVDKKIYVNNGVNTTAKPVMKLTLDAIVKFKLLVWKKLAKNNAMPAQRSCRRDSLVV